LGQAESRNHQGARRKSYRFVQVKCLSRLEGTTPLGVEPGQDSEQTDLNRSRLHDVQVPEAVVVHGGDIDAPNHASSGNQARQTLFSAYVEQAAFTLRLPGGLLNGDDGNELILRADVALAAGIPIDVSVLV